MRTRDLDSLDYSGVCKRLADFATSEAGKRLCRDLTPTRKRAEAEAGLRRTREMLRLIEHRGRPPISAFPDIQAHLNRATPMGSMLGGEALVEIRVVLDCLRDCHRFFDKHSAAVPSLGSILSTLTPLPALRDTLHRSLDHDGHVLDQASDELAAIRVSIRRLRNTLSQRLEDLVARRGMNDVVADQYVTLRNNRFVIPVKASSASRLQGVVQDRSVSGETFFVEPLFAVELNNSLLNAVRDEEAIVRRILADLTDLVRTDTLPLAEAIGRLSEVDCIVAKARFAIEYSCTQPTFTDGEIDLDDARHPGLVFTGRPVTPIDIKLPKDKRALVVTGPNTGGKTVALKTLGSSALMAQSGLLVFASEGARLPLFDRVFTDVGDEQNIERDLSTFSAHVVNLREILAQAGEGSLILLDEPGVGTDPEEGAALAVGLLRYFESRTARIAVTTHYRSVKLHAVSSDACHVAAVDFDVEQLEPRYRLVYHSLGRSLALPIAERLGLDPEVLEAAREAQSEESRTFSDVLDRLEASRRDLELTREELNAQFDALAAQRTELSAREAESARLADDLRERRSRAWKEEVRAAREFLRELKEKGRTQLRAMRSSPNQRAEFASFVRAQEESLEGRVDALAAPAVAPATTPPAEVFSTKPTVGDTVEVGDRGIQGELLSVDGQRAWIQRGTLRFEVPAAQLRKVGRRKRAAPQVRIDRTLDRVEREVTLVGLRARQALEKLETFLDHAAQTDQNSVRIIHGIGSGALQRAVRDYLSTSPYCIGFRQGDENEGGAGVTVAVLE